MDENDGWLIDQKI